MLAGILPADDLAAATSARQRTFLTFPVASKPYRPGPAGPRLWLIPLPQANAHAPGLGQGRLVQGGQPAVELDRQTVGAQTMDHGVLPVLIGFPGVFVAALIGVTVPGTWLAT
jgi:hypothetical protein